MSNYIRNKLAEKFLAVSILLVLFLFAFFIFDKFYIDHLISAQQQIELKQKKLVKVNSILAKEKELNKLIKQKNIKSQKNRLFLKNNIPSTASSELQNKLKKLIVAQSRARILTIKPYPVVEHDNYSETTLEIRMKDLKHQEIQKILYLIESEMPVLLIKELDIKRTQLRFKSVVKPKSNEEKLEVILVVSGFFKEKQA